MEHFGISPGHTLVTGDGVQDIRSAKAAGCIACGVSYGLSGAEELRDAGADLVVNNLEDILQFKVDKEKILFFT